MPPKTQEIEGSEEAVQVLHRKLQSLFEKIDKKEQEAEEVEKVYISVIFYFISRWWVLSFHIIYFCIKSTSHIRVFSFTFQPLKVMWSVG